MNAIAPFPPFLDVKGEQIPTSPADRWSHRNLYLSRPESGHEHVYRGNEFGGGLCAGNSNYEVDKVNDQHEMRGFGFNVAFGEHRQIEKQWGTVYSQLPPNTVGTLMVLEIKTEWIYVADDRTPNAWPTGAGPTAGDWRWGIAYDMIASNGTGTDWQNMIFSFNTADTVLFIRRGRTPKNTWNVYPSGVGNVFRGIQGEGVQDGSLAHNLHYTDLRLQMILRTKPRAGFPGTYAQYIDHWYTPNGIAWYYVGQKEIDLGTISPTQPPRLRRIIWGSGFDQNRSLNPTMYRARRMIDHYTLLWNPVKQPSQFVWVQ